VKVPGPPSNQAAHDRYARLTVRPFRDREPDETPSEYRERRRREGITPARGGRARILPGFNRIVDTGRLAESIRREYRCVLDLETPDVSPAVTLGAAVHAAIEEALTAGAPVETLTERVREIVHDYTHPVITITGVVSV
jgi:hypothetical protein